MTISLAFQLFHRRHTANRSLYEASHIIMVAPRGMVAEGFSNLQEATRVRDELVARTGADVTERLETADSIGRNEILDVAEQVITSQGVDHLNLATVTQLLGIEEVIFHRHFGSVSDLLEEVVREMCTFSVPLFKRTIEGQSVADGISVYFSRYLSVDHLSLSKRMCPIANLGGAFHALSDSARESYSAAYSGLVDEIATQLRCLSVPSPYEEATALMTQASGAFMIARALPSGRDADEILAVSRTIILNRIRDFGQSAEENAKAVPA